jgi:hypothetical protein
MKLIHSDLTWKLYSVCSGIQKETACRWIILEVKGVGGGEWNGSNVGPSSLLVQLMRLLFFCWRRFPITRCS